MAQTTVIISQVGPSDAARAADAVRGGVSDDKNTLKKLNDALEAQIQDLSLGGVVGIVQPNAANHDFAVIDANGFVGMSVYDGDLHTPYAGSSARLALAPSDAALVARSASLKQAPHNFDGGYITDFNLVISEGQSFSTGTAAQQNLSRTARDDCFMIGLSVRGAGPSGNSWTPQGGSAVLTPLVATVDNGAPATPFNDAAILAAANNFTAHWNDPSPPNPCWGETLLESTVNGLARAYVNQAGGRRPRVEWVAASSGVGGTAVAEWVPGATPNIFNRIPNVISAFVGLAQARNGGGAPYGCAVRVFQQGQQDITLNTTLAAYKSGFLTWRANSAAQMASLMGQSALPIDLVFQTGGHYVNDANLQQVANAQLELGWENPGIFVVGPDGYLPDNRDYGNAHPVANGHRWMGNQAIKVAQKVVVERKKWEPCAAIWHAVSGNRRSIYVGIHTPEPPLQIVPIFNGLNPSTARNLGFMVEDLSGVPAIKSVGLAGACIVEIVMSQPLQGSDAQIFVTIGNNAQNGCANIADSDPTISQDVYQYLPALGMRAAENLIGFDGQPMDGRPYPLFNWLCNSRRAANWRRA